VQRGAIVEGHHGVAPLIVGHIAIREGGRARAPDAPAQLAGGIHIKVPIIATGTTDLRCLETDQLAPECGRGAEPDADSKTLRIGNKVGGGEVGYRSATVSSGKWKLLVSSIVPQGKVILKHRSAEQMKAVYVYAPYVPALLTPYPLGNNPSLTVLSRYASKVIRPEGLAVLTVTDTA
jgi:hypothetical protein